MELKWIGVAFLFGLLARRVGQPPLVGYLLAGLALEMVGFELSQNLVNLADVGVQMLLFAIGLKLDLGRLTRKEVWGTTLIHMGVVIAAVTGVALGLAWWGLPMVRDLDLQAAALVAFALSFSSTVFVVKLLEERDDLRALYGRIAVGVLVVQDLVAVLFLAFTSGRIPSPWALLLLLLLPARRSLQRFLVWCGHGELLVLGGVAITLTGVGLFELVDLKGDLGALLMGALIGGSPKAGELSKALDNVKDLLLVGFFLSVGLTGLPTWETVSVALILLGLAAAKSGLFLLLFLQFDLRARSAVFAALALGNFSEFGLIVGARAVQEGWLGDDWMVVIALALSFSFFVGMPLNERAYPFYRWARPWLCRWESGRHLPGEEPVQVEGASILVCGMGRVGTAAYEHVRERAGDVVVGLEVDEDKVAAHQETGRRVVLASATDADVWSRLSLSKGEVRLVLLAMASHAENRTAVTQLRADGYTGHVAATARFPDEVEDLRAAGVDVAVHVMEEAGKGFARDAIDHVNREDAVSW